MAHAVETQSMVILRQIQDRATKVWGRDLKIIIPEFDLTDTRVTAYNDASSQKMVVRVDFTLEPNGLK